jgi:tetratricopeptide (TPR) repeat protein
MKYQRFALLALVALLAASVVAAQIVAATVRGKAVDEQGKPLEGITVTYKAKDTGRTYSMKTDKKGEYVNVGVSPGVYEITFSKDGKTLWIVDAQILIGGENMVVYDPNKVKEQAMQQLTEEQKKQLAEAEKEKMTVKQLNDMLAQTQAAMEAGNFDAAIATMTEATRLDPSRDVLWYKLGDSHLAAGNKIATADRAAAGQHMLQAIEAYKKAIEIKQAETAKDPAEKNQRLGAYQNNLAQALSRIGKVDEAVAAYTAAAQIDTANAAMYYFNSGAVLTNAGRADEAVDAFDRTIAADPNKAEAYYWKGVNLLGKAEEKEGKMVAPPGTAEALNKYIELKPDGQFVEPAKEMLGSIGAEVTSGYRARPTRRR